MNRFKILVFGCFFMAATVLSAQEIPNNALTIKPVWINYKAPNNDNKGIFNDLNNAFEIGYSRKVTDWLSIGLPLRFGGANFPRYDDTLKRVTSYTNRAMYGGLDLLGNVHFWRSAKVSPFAYAGLGGVLENLSDFYLQAPIGLGLDFRLSNWVSLIAQSDYRVAFKNGYDNWQHAVGIRVCLCALDKDRDGDGVSDDRDACPDVAGLAALNGCPDSDNDGIADKDDKCPNLAGVPENMGCPSDRDRDGVYDSDDLCPDVAGLAGLRGCPDSDGDGIADKDDKCPNVAGVRENMGCPSDRDRDGVYDSNDLCPDIAGLAALSGCPDSDGDGLADKDDKCPQTPGPISNGGCPEIKVEDRKKLDVAMRSVEFETGTATITKKSFKNLDDVVSVLNSYPEMMVSIEGHTDNVGDDAMNQKLSEKRAKACLDYLVSKGIAASRCTYIGYGETRPIGDNNTKEGRQLNRRTEFNPVWR